MQRSLQLQILSFLAALATLGAALRPTFDTLLFAVAFVFGTLLMQVRDRLEKRREGTLGMLGKVLGAALPWAFAATRAWSHVGSRLPARLTPSVIVAAAVVPTGIFLFDAIRALLNRAPARQPD
ncbi:MAG: hypothetical protein ACXWP4_17870 [Polyangiales bacterium]